MVKQEYSSIKNAFEKVTTKWFELTAKTRLRKILSTILLILLTIYLFISTFVFIHIITVIIFIFSIRFADTRQGIFLFYIGLAILIAVNYVLWIIPMGIGIYLLYTVLNDLRIKRIEKIAHMNPSQLSGVRFEKPEVEIIIRGGGRK